MDKLRTKKAMQTVKKTPEGKRRRRWGQQESLGPLLPCLRGNIRSWTEVMPDGRPDFPGGPVLKNPLANAADTGSIPGPG